MAQFTEDYTRKQGLHRRYKYSVTTTQVGESLLWSAVIRHEGLSKGTPTGRILYKLPNDVIEATVRTQVEKAIEELDEVEE